MKRRASFIGLVVVSALVLAPLVASAHLKDKIGDYDASIGWVTEPALTGEVNAVQLTLTRNGRGADPSRIDLKVEVLFGDKDSEIRLAPLSITPAAAGTGEFRSSSFIPTRPGTYSFLLTGKVDGKDVKKTYTSGDEGAIEGARYDDVRERAGISFPEQDPTNADLARGIERLEGSVDNAVSDASDEIKDSRNLSIAALGVAGAGLLLARIGRGRGKKIKR